MKLRLVTVTYDPKTGQFPSDPLQEVEGEILSVVEHFFHHDGVPHLLLVLHHRPPSDSATANNGSPSRRRPRPDPTKDLTQEERQRYEKLRTWRRGRAEADGVPVYIVFDNRQLVEIARRCPKTLPALREIRGVGEHKASRYGRQVLKVVRTSFKSQQSSTPSPASPVKEAPN